MAKKVYLEVGHGGSDPGAVGNGFKEKDLTLAISKHVTQALTRCGVECKAERTTDVDIDLNTTVKQCNKYAPDCVVSIHLNAFNKEAQGAEVYHSIVSPNGKKLAQNILDNIVALGVKSRGIKTKTNSAGADYFAIIRDTDAPAVLVECCFIDSADIKFVDTAAEQKAMAEAITKGVCKFLGVTYKAEEVKKPAATTTKPATASVKAGQAVKLTNAPLYVTAKSKTPANYKTGTFYLWSASIVSGRIRITNSAANVGKAGQVTGFIDVSEIDTNVGFKPYLVKVTASILNVRAGAGTGYKVNTTVRQGQVYTIVDEQNGWGKLKSGAGWIYLDYTKKA